MAVHRFIKAAALALGVTSAIAAGPLRADIIVMGGNPEGSLFYAQSQALASVIGGHSDIRVDVLPQSATVYFPMMQTQEVDIGLSSPIEAAFAHTATGPYDGANGGSGYDIRTIMLGSPIRLSLVVRGSSDIETVTDLVGQNVVADYGAFAGSSITSTAVLANAGLSTEEVEVVVVSSYPEGVNAVIEGRADAAVGSIGSGILQQLAAAEGARILPIDPSNEAMARAREIGSAFVPLLVPAGPVGVDEDTHVLSYATTLYARGNLDDETVRAILEVLWEHSAELQEIHRSLVTWTPDRFAGMDAVVPFHPAAIAFYREMGEWTDEHEALQTQLLARGGN